MDMPPAPRAQIDARRRSQTNRQITIFPSPPIRITHQSLIASSIKNQHAKQRFIETSPLGLLRITDFFKIFSEAAPIRKRIYQDNRVGGFRPLSNHRTCHLCHTVVSRRVIGPGTNVPAATLYLSSSDTLTIPPHRYVDSDLHRFPSLDRGFVHFSTSWLCCYMF